MKRIYATLWVVVCLFAVAARAQESSATPTPKNLVFDIKIVDTDAATLETMEVLAKDRNRLNQMLAEGKAKLVAGTKLYALINERTAMRIGQRVPVQTATFPAFQPPAGNRPNNTASQQALNLPFAAPGVPQIQYENSGLSLEFEPRLRRDGTIDLVYKIELTIVSSESGKLKPTFITRNITGVVKIKQNQPPIILEMYQNDFPAQASAATNPANSLRGNFFILFSAKEVD
jgi:hypothetical protein